MPQIDRPQTYKKPPWLFYGYIVVLAAFVIQFMMFAPRASFGIYIKPFIADFEWSRGLISGAFALSTILIGFAGIAAGALNDRFGPRVLLTFLGAILGAAYLLMSLLGAPWQLYVFYSVGVGIGMGGFYVPMLSTVARWFNKRRAVMTGITLAGGGIGGIVGPVVLQWISDTQGWRNSFLIMGGAVLVIIVVIAQLLRKNPASKGLQPYGTAASVAGADHTAQAEGLTLQEARRTRQFWMAGFMQFCQGFCMITMLVHIAPHATDIGLSATSAAVLISTISGSHVAGGVILGGVADRIGTRKVFLISFTLIAVAMLWLLYAHEMWMLVIFAVVLGIGGGSGSLNSPMMAELFGLKSHGVILGTSAFATTIGASLGPFLAGIIFDNTGSYLIIFCACIALAMLGFLTTLLLRPPRHA